VIYSQLPYHLSTQKHLFFLDLPPNRIKGFFVSFDFSSDGISEIQSFFKKTGKSIIALTVKDILEEQIAYKLA